MTNLNKLLEKKQAESKGKPDLSLPTTRIENILTTVKEISLTNIKEDLNQPRKEYAKEKITALAESIKTKGLIQPIIVKTYGKDYLIIAGHRRYKAYKELGKEFIPCIVKEENLSDNDLTELALIENLQREDLNTLEIAESIYSLKELRNISQKEIATVTGYSEGNISKYIQLFDAIKDKPERKDKILNQRLGMEKAYHYFCVEEKRKKKNKKTATESKTFIVEVKNINHKREIERAIKQAEIVLSELKGLLKNAK